MDKYGIEINIKDSLGFTFPFHIVFHVEMFAIEHGVGELMNPVAEHEEACLVAQRQVEFDMAVSENKEVDIVVRF